MKNPKETNRKGKRIIRIITAVLVIVLILLLTRCQGCGKFNIPDEPTETATSSTEATEAVAVTETSHGEETEATEPSIEETEAEETTEATEGAKAPKPTEKPHKHDYTIKDKVEAGCYTDGYTVYWCTCGDSFTKKAEARGYHNWTAWTVVKAATTESEGREQRSCKDCEATETKTIGKLTPQVKPTEPKPTEPKPTEPKPTEPKPTEPKPTEPKPTEPKVPETQPSHSEETEATKPTTCQHSWQEVHHAEKGHEEVYDVCNCGARFKTTSEWIAHSNSFSNAEALANHGGHGSVSVYVVDSPAYTEWVCSKCGAATTTKP